LDETRKAILGRARSSARRLILKNLSTNPTAFFIFCQTLVAMRQKKIRIKAAMKYLVLLIVVLMVAIFQDRLHSKSTEYAFYESEPLLSNSYVILILPVAWVCWISFSNIPVLSQIQPIFFKRILFITLATTLQILLFAGLVQIVSAMVYGQELDLVWNLRYILAEDLYQFLLIYSVIALVLIRREKKPKIPTTT
jgi:hypothetical protein